MVLQESEPEDELTVEECLSLYAGYYPRPRPVTQTLELAGQPADLAGTVGPAVRRHPRRRSGYRASTAVVRRPVAMAYTWPETLTFGVSKGEVSSRSTSAWTVACGSATTEAASAASARPGGGEKAGCALRVVDDRDFEERVCRVLAAEQLLGEEGDEGDVVDDGLGDSSPSVADDGSLAELEPEDDRGVDPVVEAGDDEQLRGGYAERRRGVGTGELLVACEQGSHPGHGSFSFHGVMSSEAAAGRPTPCRSATSRIAAASKSGCSLVVR